jgi:hypothetical protein
MVGPMFSSAMVVWLKSVKSEIREQVLGLVRKGKGRQTKRKEIGEDASAATGRLIDRRARFRFRSTVTLQYWVREININQIKRVGY